MNNYNSNQIVGTKMGSLTYRNKNNNFGRKSGENQLIIDAPVIQNSSTNRLS